ncbi:putative TOM core complex subunit Tom6 [Rosellinia necatrix]|uniref:Putative TOM core complex subunit Tom6 n=1 Tax=Rosellinia necatrix TaxID=77044 RepID=A0A1S8A5C4_ROSNE|nr:putative TOM core complex subunit Tom6 [Rosellinia necatrix]
MPPRRVLESGGPRSRAPKSAVASVYAALTSAENASVVKSVAIFGAAVAFFASPWSEFLLPPA